MSEPTLWGILRAPKKGNGKRVRPNTPYELTGRKESRELRVIRKGKVAP